MISEKVKNQIQVVQGDITKLDCDCIVNAANEIVNAGFRKGECGFLQMADIIEETMAKATFDSNPDLDVYLQTDAEARRIATELMHK